MDHKSVEVQGLGVASRCTGTFLLSRILHARYHTSESRTYREGAWPGWYPPQSLRGLWLIPLESKAVDRYSFCKHLCGEYVMGVPAAWEAAYQLWALTFAVLPGEANVWMHSGQPQCRLSKVSSNCLHQQIKLICLILCWNKWELLIDWLCCGVGHHQKNKGSKQLGSINVLSVTDIDKLGVYPQPKKSLCDSWYVVVTLRSLSIHSLMWIMLSASSACPFATLLPHISGELSRSGTDPELPLCSPADKCID